MDGRWIEDSHPAIIMPENIKLFITTPNKEDIQPTLVWSGFLLLPRH